MDKCTATTLLSPLCVAALIPLACLAGTARALAADPAPELRSAQSVRSVTVSYRDLNLTTVAGATTLDQRIRGAARTVCGHEGRRLMEQTEWRNCYRGAIARAVASVNNPLLTAVHSGEKVQTL